jgi:dUTP pyrophosphatase
VNLPVKRLDPEVALPSYAHEGDAGLDLSATEDVVLAPGERALVPTGIAVAIPTGFAGFVLPRSGQALRAGLSLANSPGLIDSHYRGEVKVIAINLDAEQPIRIARGDKIAQLVVQPVERVAVVEFTDLDRTARGEAGFGSTGR